MPRANVHTMLAMLPWAYRKSLKESIYKSRTARCLEAIAEGYGLHYNSGYREIIDMLDGKPQTEQSAEDIAADIISKAGLNVIGGEDDELI